jgi:S1-C subfamily serine protease
MGGEMTKTLLAVQAIALALLLVLVGCAGESQIAGKPFGKAKSLYEAPSNIEEFIEIAQDATLHVFCETKEEELPYAGSGFHIEVGDDRYLITNAHVIEGCIDEAAELIVYDSDYNAHSVQLLAYRHFSDWRGDWDVAVLTGRDFGRALTIAEDFPQLGHWSMTVGWPSVNGNWYQQIAPGQILGLSPDGVIVSDSVSAPGMSGGPVLNSNGELIGIHYARSADDTRRALAQPVENLCQVAFVCAGDGRPFLPLEFPVRPIKTFLEIED